MIILLKDNDLTINTPLGGNIDPDKYNMCIQDAQRTKLEEILGDKLYYKILKDFEEDTLKGKYLELYEEYIKPFLIHQSAVEYLLIGAYNINNSGISKPTPNNAVSVEKNEVDYLVQNQRSKAEVYQQRLEKWLYKNRLTEYVFCSDNIVNPTRQNTGNWYYVK